MYKVLFKLTVLDYLSLYFTLYRKYYEDLYRDSWLWSENQIIEWYINESTQRKQEIINLIEKRLSEKNILGKKIWNRLIVQRRSKYIFIQWIENKELQIRQVSEIDIR